MLNCFFLISQWQKTKKGKRFEVQVSVTFSFIIYQYSTTGARCFLFLCLKKTYSNRLISCCEWRFLLALIIIYIPKATFLIKLWLQKFRWVIGDLNPRTSDLETNSLPPQHQWLLTKTFIYSIFERSRLKNTSKYDHSTDPQGLKGQNNTWPGQGLKFQYMTNLHVMWDLSEDGSRFCVPNFSIWHSITKETPWQSG